jgi:tetratricopeptide (TPR) repeat protein
MLFISATIDRQADLQALVAATPGLADLLTLVSLTDQPDVAADLHVDAEGLHILPDWANRRPPLISASAAPLTQANLLGALCFQLGDLETAYQHWQACPGWHTLAAQGLGGSPDTSPCSEFEEAHNRAILQHYLPQAGLDYAALCAAYAAALATAPDASHRAYTARHFATLLTDHGEAEPALTLLNEASVPSLPLAGRIALKTASVAALLQGLAPPYDADRMAELKAFISDCLAYYEAHSQPLEVALQLQSASLIASLDQSYAEALGYIQRALRLFEAEGATDLWASAMLRQATLLQSWAGEGQPQFFRAAIESYQKALKVFTQADAPEAFADIHHHLALIYTEMPAPREKKGLLAGLAVSSFETALEYFTQERSPYQFASICNNFGNAFTRFPTAYGLDNYRKAIHYLEAALTIRQPETHPEERATTILNLLEAYWELPDEQNVAGLNQALYQKMLRLAAEVPTLSQQIDLHQRAEAHLDQLRALGHQAGVAQT